jgi:hypothetical protein
MNSLINRLLLNALSELMYNYGNAGCNDLDLNHPILKGITPKEFLEIKEKWEALCPLSAKEQENEMHFDTNVVELLTTYLKKNY